MKLTITSFLFFLLLIQNCIAQKQPDSLNYYSNLALRPQNASDLSNAYNYFDSRYKELIQNNQVLQAVNTLYYKSSVLYKNGEFDLSEKTAVIALEQLDNQKESDYIICLGTTSYHESY